MPFGDGTGPRGEGCGTGRGFGRFSARRNYGNIFVGNFSEESEIVYLENRLRWLELEKKQIEERLKSLKNN